MRHGKFHLNPLRNGAHALSDPVVHSWYRALPKSKRSRIAKAIDFGRLKKKYKKLLSGDNSAASIQYYDTGSGYLPGGYQYHGRTLSQMTGGS